MWVIQLLQFFIENYSIVKNLLASIHQTQMYLLLVMLICKNKNFTLLNIINPDCSYFRQCLVLQSTAAIFWRKSRQTMIHTVSVHFSSSLNWTSGICETAGSLFIDSLLLRACVHVMHVHKRVSCSVQAHHKISPSKRSAFLPSLNYSCRAWPGWKIIHQQAGSGSPLWFSFVNDVETQQCFF